MVKNYNGVLTVSLWRRRSRAVKTVQSLHRERLAPRRIDTQNKAPVLSTRNNTRCCVVYRRRRLFTVATRSNMSEATAVSDEKKHGNAAAGSAVSISSFSIDGLLGLKHRDAADKKVKDEEKSEKAETNSATFPSKSATISPVAATHLVYSAAAASTMVPSPSAFHGALWSSHPATAAIAAFRCKYITVYFVRQGPCPLTGEY